MYPGLDPANAKAAAAAAGDDSDPVEMYEEMERMREEVFKESDTNKDLLITIDEFLNWTRSADFIKTDNEWEVHLF